jgi:hypothetical protein
VLGFAPARSLAVAQKGAPMNMVLKLGCAFAVIVVVTAVENAGKPGSHSSSSPTTDQAVAAVKWSQATCHRFAQIKEVIDCEYSAGGLSGYWVAVTMAIDSARDAVLLCPAFVNALPHPISNFEMRIKLAATGGVGAVCNRVRWSAQTRG